MDLCFAYNYQPRLRWQGSSADEPLRQSKWRIPNIMSEVGLRMLEVVANGVPSRAVYVLVTK